MWQYNVRVCVCVPWCFFPPFFILFFYSSSGDGSSFLELPCFSRVLCCLKFMAFVFCKSELLSGWCLDGKRQRVGGGERENSYDQFPSSPCSVLQWAVGMWLLVGGWKGRERLCCVPGELHLSHLNCSLGCDSPDWGRNRSCSAQGTLEALGRQWSYLPVCLLYP